MTSNKKQVHVQFDGNNIQSNSYLVKANAQLGDDGLTPKIFLVNEELHLATMPLVGRFEKSSFFIH